MSNRTCHIKHLTSIKSSRQEENKNIGLLAHICRPNVLLVGVFVQDPRDKATVPIYIYIGTLMTILSTPPGIGGGATKDVKTLTIQV